MVKAAVCDDIQLVADAIKKILDQRFNDDEIKTDSFSSGKKLLKTALETHYDILIMDIELSEKGKSNKVDENGMLLAKRIKDKYPDTIIIFITGKPEYERDLLGFEPFRYVRKPLVENEKELIEAVGDALWRIKNWKNVSFRVRVAKGLYANLYVKDIIMISSRRPQIIITTTKEEIEIRGQLDLIEEELKELSKGFVRINKSYLANIMYIKSYSSRSVFMIDGTEIPLSRNYAKKFLEKMRNTDKIV